MIYLDSGVILRLLEDDDRRSWPFAGSARSRYRANQRFTASSIN